MKYQQYEDLLVCPVCGFNLTQPDHAQLICGNVQCNRHYPVLHDIPVLINESKSIFKISNFIKGNETTFKHAEVRRNKFVAMFKHTLPTLSNNLSAKDNYIELLNLLKQKTGDKTVLVIGGGIPGKGMTDFLNDPAIQLIETDVSFGPRTSLICDCHCLPFKDASVNLVIVQAVLEHVLDPVACVSEIYRVLKEDGIVYSETPFMQQVHMREFDFTRFTHLGHRRLFRSFKEIKSGPVAGPGVGLAWAYSYFLMSFTSNRTMRNILKVFSMYTAFFLKYFDYFLIHKPGAYDAASCFYFIGEKSNVILSDEDLVSMYRGSM